MSSGNIQFFGEGGLGQKALERDIRILSTREIYALAESFSQRSGLEREQFAANQWGFPFIPIPDVRVGFDNIRTAPSNVSKSFFGHPIYWIDPDLTKRREDEGDQEWCIRMFFLIDSMGYWNDRAEFIDFLKVNDFSFDDSQIETYHRIADKHAETNNYKMLDESDIETSLKEVDDHYQDALVKCFQIQKEESMRMLQKQGIQYSFAKKAIGPRVQDWTLSYNDHGGVWHEVFLGRLEDIANEYNDRAKTGDQIVSDLLKRTRVIVEDFKVVIERFNHCTAILEMPVKASIKGAPGGAARISYIASSMSIAADKNNMRKTVYSKIDDAIKKSFLGGSAGDHGFDYVMNALSEIFHNSWNRLRLAYVNYDRLRDGEEVFSSTVEMLSHFQAEYNGESGSGFAAIMESDFS